MRVINFAIFQNRKNLQNIAPANNRNNKVLRHEHFRAKYRYVGFFFERRFQPLSVGGFFSNQRESISQCPKSPFPSKTQNRQIARTSPLIIRKIGASAGKHRQPRELRLCRYSKGNVIFSVTFVSTTSFLREKKIG